MSKEQRRRVHSISKRKRLAIYIRDSFLCAYCGIDLSRTQADAVTLDHLTPGCEGGGKNFSNLVTACLECNKARGTLEWQEFASSYAAGRIRRVKRRYANEGLADKILSAIDAEVKAGNPQDWVTLAYRHIMTITAG